MLPILSIPQLDAIARIDWYGTARARVGWTTGSLLFYGTGGLAYGNVSLTSNYNLGTLGQNAGIGPLNAPNLRRQGRLGRRCLGVEYLINRNLSLNLEYQYVDLGIVSLAGLTAPSHLCRR